MKERVAASGYRYAHAAHSHAHAYLLPAIRKELAIVRKRVGNTPPPETL
jgi:hypothetical protein